MKLILTTTTLQAGNVTSYAFRPESTLDWLPGQFVRVSLPHYNPDAKGAVRWFTVAGIPADGVLTITTRQSGSSFKRTLENLPLGGYLDLINHPAGDFVWRPAAHPHIFAAQGIGITPFYAIIKDRRHRGLPVSAALIYATRLGEPIIFEQELAAWAASDPTFQLIHEPDLLTPERIAQLAPDYARRMLYVSGPKSCLRLCMPPYQLPLSQLKQDNFPGYAAAKY